MTTAPGSRFWTTHGDGIDRLRLGTRPVPPPGPGQVLVRVTAAALNYRDLLVVQGVPGWRPEEPVVPVSDGVGVVEAVGAGVTRLVVGDRVSAMFLPLWTTGELDAERYRLPVGGPVNPGLLADHVVLHEDAASRAPSTLTDQQAATLPVAGVTAWHAVARRSRVRAGETVLVHGTGGVALFALQIAVALGARVAITSSSAAKLDLARRLGAAHTIGYRDHDVAEAALAWTGGRGVDHVVETIGGENLNTSLRAVRVGGSIAFIGLIAGRAAEITTYDLVSRNVTVHGIETGSREMYDELARFVDEQRIEPVVDSVHPFADVATALRRLEAAGHVGKVVLSDEPARTIS